jgi:hypothetical protein
VFVLDRQENSADVAVLTRLTRTDDVVSGAVGIVTGNSPEKSTPPSVRLDVVRVYADGSVHLLVPSGPPPFKFAADTPARALPPLPLDGFSASEFGVFPPRAPRNNRGEPWNVTATGNRPVETWQAKEFQFVNAERCQLLLMNQQSDDWAKPVGGQTSWHRADAVLVSTQDGTARKVHRVIRQREGRSEAPSAWVEVKYELKEQTQLSGRTFDHARVDCGVAYNALAEATQLRPDVAKLSAKTFETRLANLDFQLEKMDRTNPFREALLAARRAIDAARRGEAAPVSPNPSPPAIPPQTRSLWPEAGQAAPDFKAGTFQLAAQRGKPVVLVFFRPGGETTDLSLAVADALDRRYAGKVVVTALCVFADSSAGVKDRDRLKFTIPVYDGSAAASSYGVETAPRFALIDTDGKVRWVFTGVGAETGFLLKEQVDRLVTPASQTSVNGTTAPIGLPLPPIVSRP